MTSVTNLLGEYIGGIFAIVFIVILFSIASINLQGDKNRYETQPNCQELGLVKQVIWYSDHHIGSYYKSATVILDNGNAETIHTQFENITINKTHALNCRGELVASSKQWEERNNG